ncbi:TPA: ABC-three component system middle component 4 [Yersinia enterocolitica]
MDKLPYINVDDTLELNTLILLVVLSILGKNRNSTPILSFEKIQCLFYLIKNPSKINKILLANDKDEIFIDSKITYTVESQSVNVDILYSRKKLKLIIKTLASYGFLDVMSDTLGEIKYFTTQKGDLFLKEIEAPYISTIMTLAKKIKPLASQSAQKSIKSINSLLAGRE